MPAQPDGGPVRGVQPLRRLGEGAGLGRPGRVVGAAGDRSAGPVEVIDSDITALTAAADKVIRVGGPEPYLVNFELQSSHQTDLAETIWFRQAALVSPPSVAGAHRPDLVAAGGELAEPDGIFRDQHARRMADESV